MEIKLRDEFIKLGQALKAAGLVESGVDAKFAIQDGRDPVLPGKSGIFAGIFHNLRKLS